ncbi:laminin subunit alpha, partial [Nephila pilipes]
SLGVLAGLAANDSAAADATAKRAAEKIEDIVSKLPDDEIKAKEVPKEIEDTKQAIKAAHSYGRG